MSWGGSRPSRTSGGSFDTCRQARHSPVRVCGVVHGLPANIEAWSCMYVRAVLLFGSGDKVDMQ